MKREKYIIQRIMATFLVLFIVSLPVKDSWGQTKPIELNLATWTPPSGSFAEGIKWFVDKVESRTEDRIKIKIFWAESLAKVMELPHACRRGVADMVVMGALYFPELFPLMGSTMEWSVLWGGDIGEGVEPYRKMREEFPELKDAYKRQNQELLAFWENPPMGIISRKPMKSLSDAKGLKVRVIGTVLPKVFEAAGFIPVTMPATEAYEAAGRGVVDSMMTSLEQAYKFKWYEVCKHYSRIGILGSIMAIAVTINLDVWNKLPPDIRDVMEITGRELTNRFPSMLIEECKGQENFMSSHGVKFYELPLADQNAWRAKTGRLCFEAYVKKMEKAGYPNATRWNQRYGELLRYRPWTYK